MGLAAAGSFRQASHAPVWLWEELSSDIPRRGHEMSHTSEILWPTGFVVPVPCVVSQRWIVTSPPEPVQRFHDCD